MDFIDYLETNFTTSTASGGSQIVVHDDCPFCGAGGGRIYVDVAKQVGICFKCGQGFSGVSFVAAREGVSKAKAASLIGGSADRYVSGCDGKKIEQGDPWWPQCEPLPPEASIYMATRGFDADFCTMMGLSYSPFNTAIGDHIFWTAKRVIIPIYNRAGEAIGWQGRDISGKAKFKYFIQPGFNARESLYNIHNIQAGAPVIVVEGIMDAWGWIRAGFINVVATYGKKISNEQVLMLANLNPEKVYIAWDGDAAMKRYEFAEKYSHIFDVRIVAMGERDADEMATEELKSLLSESSVYSWEAKIMQALASV